MENISFRRWFNFLCFTLLLLFFFCRYCLMRLCVPPHDAQVLWHHIHATLRGPVEYKHRPASPYLPQRIKKENKWEQINKMRRGGKV